MCVHDVCADSQIGLVMCDVCYFDLTIVNGVYMPPRVTNPHAPCCSHSSSAFRFFDFVYVFAYSFDVCFAAGVVAAVGFFTPDGPAPPTSS